MAHSRTARKAIRQNQRRRTRNKAEMSGMRTQLKKVHAAIEGKDAAAAAAELPGAQKTLDKAAKKNRLHPNHAARIKARLAKAVDKLSKS